jgi:xanthine dehydrogenase accessory factor
MDTWLFIKEKMLQPQGVMLLYVLQSSGSSPGRQGFYMAVAEDGSMQGSVGGGIMEHKFVEMAKAKLRTEENTGAVYEQLHDKTSPVNQSGMICSGEQTIFLYRVLEKDLAHISALVDSLQRFENGTLTLSPEGIHFSNTIPVDEYQYAAESTHSFVYTEKTGYKNILHIVGGGHCSLALSKLMRSMDFFIKVYEHREELNTIQANEYAHEKQMVNNYSELDQYISPGKNVYVVIMTFGYRTDDEALRCLMGKQFKYLGLMGSRKKIEKMFDQYKTEKIKAEYLKTIHTPIGLQIKSETPAEIAVSIAAEIIAVKNKI